jgi:hypothetical protein
MHEYGPFFAFRPVCPVEPISAFYGQDGQEVEIKHLWILSGSSDLSGSAADAEF